jgi:hypothetical protein
MMRERMSAEAWITSIPGLRYLNQTQLMDCSDLYGFNKEPEWDNV